MRIEFTKLNNDRHRLELVRDDGSREDVGLETRSFLLHDLVHYAVEAEAGIEDGFWGSLARGTRLEALNDREATYPAGTGLALAESLVGPMQSCWKGRLPVDTYVDLGARAAPEIVNHAFVERVFERLRQLTGQWKATPFRVPMVLHWPPNPRRVADGS